MAEGARIYSTDALAIFRAALIKFAESGNSALTSADSDIERVIGWLERDQTTYWAGQVRKRHERVLQLEDAVRQKRLYKEIDGTTQQRRRAVVGVGRMAGNQRRGRAGLRQRDRGRQSCGSAADDDNVIGIGAG